MPEKLPEKELRKRFVAKLGKPQNDIDKDILNQLVKLGNKKIIIQYGMHISEGPGRFAGMLVRKKLENNKDVGFFEFNGVFDEHRWGMIRGRIYRDKEDRPVDAGRKLALAEFVSKNLIPSDKYDAKMVGRAIQEILKPDHHIDVHASPLDFVTSDGEGFNQSFFVLTGRTDHKDVIKGLSGSKKPILTINHFDLKHAMLPQDTAFEVAGNGIKPKESKFITKETEEFYGSDTPWCYRNVIKLDALGKKNARETARYITKFVKELLKKGT